MEKKSLLSRLKGNQRVLTVHSRNPYAGVAAAAKQLGRSEQRGPFFRFSEVLSPPSPPNDAPSDLCALAEGDDIIADFKSDWAEYLYQFAMPAYGVKVRRTRTLDDNTMRYLTAYGRIPPPRPRAVHESRELSISKVYRQDYEMLKVLITSGGDLRPYMSRDILKRKRPDKEDRLLNSWGIQHLHFQKAATDDILFCRITESNVFVIQALPHKKDSG
jgi:hypothetical protein